MELTMDNAIEVQNLRKYFGEIHAVDDVSFNVEAGEIFSLLGPNGAGKTTIISMLSCLLHPEAGDALVMGHSIRRDSMAVKSVLGVVPQEVALYDDLTAQENLAFWGKMYGLRGAALKQRVEEVLEIIGLSDRQKGRLGKFSGGMKRRVNIAVALLHKPQIIYMDEPTVGIDPQSRRSIMDNVVALKNQGMTVLYTTHYMEEAQELSKHVAIMDHGKLIAIGTQEELVHIVGEMDRIVLMVNTAAERVIEAWKATPGVKHVSFEDGKMTVMVEDSNRVLPRLFDAATASGARITSVDIQEPNLETVFLHLTGRELRD
jgi:ABC-2 type transport system ATP-binding protein